MGKEIKHKRSSSSTVKIRPMIGDHTYFETIKFKRLVSKKLVRKIKIVVIFLISKHCCHLFNRPYKMIQLCSKDGCLAPKIKAAKASKT